MKSHTSPLPVQRIEAIDILRDRKRALRRCDLIVALKGGHEVAGEK